MNKYNHMLSVLCVDTDHTHAYSTEPNEKEPGFTFSSKTKFWFCQVQFNATALRHKTDGIERSKVLQIKSKTELLNIHSEL